MSVTVGAVLERTQQMEYLLRENFGATGKGLNEYLDSIPDALPPDLIRKIRFVATTRNKLVHERGYAYDGDEADFWWLCDTIISKLSHCDEFMPAEAPLEEPAESPPVVVRENPSNRPRFVEPQPDARPWYRSTWFMLAVFLFLPPVWAIWMLLDRDRGFVVKGAATIVLLAFAIAGLTGYSLLTSTQTLGSSSTPVVVKRATTPTPSGAEAALQPSATPTESTPPTATPTGSPSARSAACILAWQEYKGDTLAGRNRNQVWNGIVKLQVAGSGMTPAKFYTQVVEQNRALQADGYVFKKGKTYLLPKCK